MSAPPGGWRGHRAGRSGADYVDGDGDGVADDVPDGRVAGEAGELGELVVVEVAGGLDGDPDLLVAGADAAVQAEEAARSRSPSIVVSRPSSAMPRAAAW